VDLQVPVHRLLPDAAGRPALGIEADGQVGQPLLQALRDGREVLLVAGDCMVDRWGKHNIFLDVDAVTTFGWDIRTVIREAIAVVDAVVVVIGPKFEAERLHQANDYVRLELKEAVAQRKLIMPVLIKGATMPKPSEFPSELAEIAFLNAPTLRPDLDFDHDAVNIMASIGLVLAYNFGKASGWQFIRFPDGSTGAV
jgi:hypothetical protein